MKQTSRKPDLFQLRSQGHSEGKKEKLLGTQLAFIIISSVIGMEGLNINFSKSESSVLDEAVFVECNMAAK